MIKLLWLVLIIFYQCKGNPVDNQPVSQGSFWPQPFFIRNTSVLYSISKKFEFRGDFSCNIINAAFKRYHRRIFKQKLFRSSTSYVHIQGIVLFIKEGCTSSVPSMEMDESYELRIGIPFAELSANEVWGALRGLETFSQAIFSLSNEYVIRKQSIIDRPRFKHRGFLIDTSRHFININTIISHMDAMEMNKMNVLHWHIVDDQSFPYQSKVWPLLSIKGSYHPTNLIYTFEDIRKVINEARLRGIRVIPEFDTPGHTKSWGKAYPYLLAPCLRDYHCTGSFGCPINPTKNMTYEFMRQLFEEVASVFVDAYIHIGGDEVNFDCWSVNDDVKQFMTNNNISNYNSLEAYYVKRIEQIVNNLSKKRNVIVWQEIFDNGVKLSEQTIVNAWKEDMFTVLDEITSAGYSVVISNPWYLNYIAYGEDWDKFYLEEPFQYVSETYQRMLILGGEVSMWSEYVDATNLLSRSWPRASAVAERLWSRQEMDDVNEASPRLAEHRCRMIRNSIQAQSIFPGFCEEEWAK